MSFNGDTEYDGISIAEWVAKFRDEGNNSPIYRMPETRVFEKTEKSLKSGVLQNQIKNILKRRGFDMS
jgi:hypothetical protein